MEVKFERQALYAEVWTTPLSKLGPKYGMSDNGLRKVCKAMNIPLPRVGHWARLAANHEVTPDPLPAVSQRSTFTSQVPARAEELPADKIDQMWLNKHREFEGQPENLIVVDPDPTKWHPKLIELRRKSLDAAKRFESGWLAKEKALAASARSKATGPNWEPLVYSYVDEGGMLFSRHDSVVFRVSLLTLNRALAIANALFCAAENRGCTVGVTPHGDRLLVQLESASFSIALRERQAFTMVERTGFSASLGPEKQYRPTDKLAIAVDKSPGSLFEIVDTASARVEQRLNDLFIRLYSTVVLARAASRVQKIKDEQRAIANLAYEELTRQRAVEAKLKADEDGRRRTLIEESAAWHEAERIRAYSRNVMEHAVAPTSLDVSQWFEWALSVAESKDPTSSRVAAIELANSTEPSPTGPTS